MNISLFLVILLLLIVNTIKSQLYEYNNVDCNSQYNYNVTVDVDNDEVKVFINGPTSGWYGIGFGNTMPNTYAMIVDQQGEHEYILASNARGSAVANAEITGSTNSDNDIIISRSIAGNDYTFPNDGSDIETICAYNTGDDDFSSSTSMSGRSSNELTTGSLTPTASPGEDTFASAVVCFAGSGNVQILNNNNKVEFKKMRDLEIGDNVLVDTNKYEKVLLFADYRHPIDHESQVFNFISLILDNGNTVTATKSHYIFINNNNNKEMKLFGDIKVGDIVYAIDNKLTTVKNIQTTIDTGLYSPITSSGSIVVDNTIVSIYTKDFPNQKAGQFLINTLMNPMSNILSNNLFKNYYSPLCYSISLNIDILMNSMIGENWHHDIDYTISTLILTTLSLGYIAINKIRK